jgi:hypothetical protein
MVTISTRLIGWDKVYQANLISSVIIVLTNKEKLELSKLRDLRKLIESKNKEDKMKPSELEKQKDLKKQKD